VTPFDLGPISFTALRIVYNSITDKRLGAEADQRHDQALTFASPMLGVENVHGRVYSVNGRELSRSMKISRITHQFIYFKTKIVRK
jgi:hypothetical protein